MGQDLNSSSAWTFEGGRGGREGGGEGVLAVKGVRRKTREEEWRMEKENATAD